MTSNDSKRNSGAPDGTSEAVHTRRRRVPGPEAGFGKRLREARGLHTQADVAKRAKVARSAYARYETGGRYPSVPELRRLCDALSVSPEYLIFGETGPTFSASASPLNEVAPDGDSEQAKMSRLVLTGVLLGALPTSEANAFRELIWAAATKQLSDQPEALAGIVELCNAVAESSWTDMRALIDEKFESDPNVRQIVESLSDNGEDDP